MKRLIALPLVCALACSLVASLELARAESAPYISVGQAKAKKTVIAIAPLKVDAKSTGPVKSLAQVISETLTKDLEFMDLFKIMGQAAFIEDPAKGGLTTDTFKMSDWSSIGTEFLVKTGISLEGQNLAIELYLYDVAGNKRTLGKRYLATTADVKTAAHTAANDIVTALTGLPGIFLTKIAMSCDRSGKKDIYIMNFDGSDVKQVTHHRSIAFAPAWSPDGSRIVYSLYNRHKGNIKNIDLYEFDFAKSSYKMLSNRKGINSGAAYHPDGRRIALTMSFLGNPEVFMLDPSVGSVTRLTKSFGFDVDPAWNSDGSKMAFVSSRSGKPMVFSMNADGSNVTRLTYAGTYNATPSWSPANNKMAFAGWLEKRFDIFIMNPDGTHIERLTKNQGNNEDPHFSPDGNFLVFSSNRTGQKNIYVMNVDGTFTKRLTYGLGNCVSPKWSNPPR